MKILVTGGTGYIGSHTVVELLNSGFDVLIVDDLSNSEIGVLDGIAAITGRRPAFEQFNLTDTGRTVTLFQDHPDIAAVIHFAASKSVSESVEKPLKYYFNNLVSLGNILEAMEQSSVRHIVFSSSCTVYGQPEKLPVREDSPFMPAVSPYGHTKQISEQMIRDFCRVSPVNAVLLRYFNPIGAHPTALIGELPLGTPNNLMPYIVQTAAGQHEYLRVWGDDYDTPDGTAVRDYIHVVDLARAHVAAVERMTGGLGKEQVEVFNLGTGTGYSVLDVIRSFERSTGISLNYRILGRRPGDVEKVWADPGYANRELGWEAKLSLDDMTQTSWKWQQTLLSRSKVQ